MTTPQCVVPVLFLFAVKPGDWVNIRSLNTRGQIVEIRKNRARISIGALTTEVPIDQLTAANAPVASNPSRTETKYPEKRELPTLDLHGLTVDEALSRLDNHIDKALRHSVDRIQVMHGRGSGKLETAIHRLLTSHGSVKHFALSNSNPGITWIYL